MFRNISLFFLLTLASTTSSRLGEGINKVVDIDSTIQDNQELRRLDRPLKKVNSNPGAKSLQKCQGDCGSDNDCAGNLICYQASSRGSVPGCAGTSDGTDYCVDPNESGGGGSNPSPPSGGGSDGGSDGGSGGGSSTGGSFQIKMYWEQGYKWQEDPQEKRWCLQCADCGSGIIFDNSGIKCKPSSCAAGNQIRLEDCGKGGEKFSFVSASGGTMIKTSQNTCFTRTNSKMIKLDKCNSNDNMQKFKSLSGSKFSLIPVTDGNLCGTQIHHPKRGEPLGFESCKEAKADTTAYWVKH